MKKTIACVAVISGAMGSVAMAGPKKAEKAERDPAAMNYRGYTFAGCQPLPNAYTGDDAYRNDCIAPVQMIEVPAGGMMPPGEKVKVAGCDDRHRMIVSSTPMRFICLPPGAVEL